MSRVSRRRFLALAAGAGGLAALGSVRWLGRAGEAGTVGEAAGLQAVRQTSSALGARVSILALHRQAETARRAVAAAFGELERVECVMSLYRADSQLCRLNREGTLADPHPYLVKVMEKAREIAARSDGAFDVTVQPLWDLYATCQRERRGVTQADLDRVHDSIDWRKIDVSASRVQLGRRGMAITLNGIAQGFAADRVLAVLREQGVEHALVDTGEIGSLGRKADGRGWVAGIQHPRQPEAYVSLAALDGRCLSTSGDYATTFTEDFTVHHVFDPTTGRSPRELASVTVVAPQGVDADALSTAAMVLGLERGRELIDATAGADALFVRKDGDVVATANFPVAEQEGADHA